MFALFNILTTTSFNHYRTPLISAPFNSHFLGRVEGVYSG